ncbi:beta-lactamase class C [Corynebacterium deserti GIMN1.010]|uniref:Beta-lactamase class C n=1 Tax=Corynebacterium deserti GIMN1.010 TaxID=931089 RepID=A0A0M4CKE7_9CORY|nr:serine hydrolase domain-containing protein [Corynebacterium deserti]ALC06426.1 beta-lactamase class C [Corynebacterium deserti GIMN1.010]
MQSFKTLESWPVDNVSASVVADGSVSTFGDVNHVFELMSVTKLLASYGYLVAIEEGVFELDSPLGPEGSTVRHLMSHASGVAFGKPVAEKGVAERRIYSSAGIDILAGAVAEEAEMPYSQYLREAVFEPLGMDRTELWGSAGHEARSTVADLTKFAQELIEPTLISAETLAEAFTVQFPDLIGTVPGYGMQKPCPWGLGFEIKGQKSPHWTGDTMPEKTVGHFGQSGTYLWVVPNSGRAGVVLTDRDFGPWAKPLWTTFNDEVWAELNG